VRFDWTAFYLAGRKLGLQPSEFWDMTLPEFFAEMDAAVEEGGKGKPQKGLSEQEAQELLEWMKDEPAADCR
jgi:hypothetical protein